MTGRACLPGSGHPCKNVQVQTTEASSFRARAIYPQGRSGPDCLCGRCFLTDGPYHRHIPQKKRLRQTARKRPLVSFRAAKETSQGPVPQPWSPHRKTVSPRFHRQKNHSPTHRRMHRWPHIHPAGARDHCSRASLARALRQTPDSLCR